MPTTTRQSSSHRAFGAPAVAQPARKSSISLTQRRDEAKQLLESARAREANRADAMDLDNEHFIGGVAKVLHPLRDMAERVGREVELFAEKLDSWRPSKQDNPQSSCKAALGLVNDYKIAAEQTVARLTNQHGAERKRRIQKKLNKGKGQTDGEEEDVANQSSKNLRVKTTVEDLVQWQEELHTWSLLHELITCSHLDSLGSTTEAHAQRLSVNTDDRYAADGQNWIEFLSSSETAREKLIVMKWLESSAEQTGTDLEVIEESLENLSGRGKALFGSGWIDTRAKLKSEKRLRLWDAPIDSGLPDIADSKGTGQLVTQLDLDAINRQNRTIEDSDRNFESSFWVMVWEMLRRGTPMKELHEWCTDRNEYARAVSLGACATSEQSSGVEWRYRWRQVCICLAKKGGLTAHERAVYGLLGGDAESSDLACKKWDDFIYTSYSCSLLDEYAYHTMNNHNGRISRRIENDWRAQNPRPLDVDLVGEIRSTMTSLQMKNASRLNDHQPLKHIQASLIAHNIHELALQQGVNLARQAQEKDTEAYLQIVQTSSGALVPEKELISPLTDNPDALRILTHVSIIYQALGQDFGSAEEVHMVENVICAYMEYLRLAGKLTLIPLYASMLSDDQAVTAMAHILPVIFNPQERLDTIKLMEVAGLNVVAILKMQYGSAIYFSNLKQDKVEEFKRLDMLVSQESGPWPRNRIAPFKLQALEEEEDVLIRSLEWFLLIEGHWALAFATMTQVAKRFLTAGRVNAALELYKRLPFTEVSMMLTTALLGKSVDIMDEHEGSDEEQPPPLRRSSRNPPMFRAQRGPRSATPQRDKVFRGMLQTHSRTYHELGLLATALDCLWGYRALEGEYIAANENGTELHEAKQRFREQMDDLESAMEPLLNDFLQVPGPADKAEQLKKLRRLYLPEMILAYISALYFAAHAYTKEHLITVMDLATSIAENDDLVECFKEAGRMAELVDALALASKAMLALKEGESSAGAARNRGKAAKTGKNMAIWEIKA